jgi:sulfofructose kinase
MPKKTFEVFGLGQCCLDYLAPVEAYPPSDSKCELSKILIQGGGPTATALVALSRWGVNCAFAGVVGDDSFGSMIRTSLAEEGVDVGGLIERKSAESQFAFIVAEPGVGHRTVFWRRPTGEPPQPDEIDFEVLRSASVFYTDGLLIEAALSSAREAKAAGVPVVVDPGSLREGMIDLARTSDYFVASEKFARELLGVHPTGKQPLDDAAVEEACRKIADLGPAVAGVTLGPKGYVALDRGKLIRRPAYQVAAVDTTGCGDVFHAGLAFGVVRGWSTEKSLDCGAWAAAMVSRELGGRLGIPRMPEYPHHS